MKRQTLDEKVFLAFSTKQASGAIPNGTRVRKTRSDPAGDFTAIGQEGVVIGSIATPDDMPEKIRKATGPYLYFVRWDHRPELPVACAASKLEAV